MGQLVQGTALDRIGTDLVFSFRIITSNYLLPWLAVEISTKLLDGFRQGSDSLAATAAYMLKNHLVAEMGDNLRPMARKKLQTTVDRLVENAKSIRDEITMPVPAEKLWDGILQHATFQFCLYGSQRLCYPALYYAYEDFLLRSYRLAKGDPDYRMRSYKDFAKDFGEQFGIPVRDSCVKDQRVNTARMARNALVHNGGRLTDELCAEPHDFIAPCEPNTPETEFHILPFHTRKLFDLLKVKVEQFITATPHHFPSSQK